MKYAFVLLSPVLAAACGGNSRPASDDFAATGPPNLSFSADEEVVPNGRHATIRWAAMGAEACEATRSYTEAVDVDDERSTEHALSLVSGTHFVAMTAIDADGNESALSNEVRKVLP